MDKKGPGKRMLACMQADAERMHQKEPAFKRVASMEMILLIVLACVFALTMRTFIYQVIRVQGESMEPNFHTNEQIIAEKLSYYFRQPERGEIVICRYSDKGIPVIKRVIGLPGETVDIIDGKVYIDAVELDESEYWNDIIYESMDAVYVPKGYIFVMGDNRNNSNDSRNVGPVPYYRIIGRAAFVLWPFKELGPILK